MSPQEQDTCTQQHQAEAEVETSLIVKLDYWTMWPREQDGGTQKHPAAQGRSRGINQLNSKTRFIKPCCHKNRMQAPNSTQQHQTEVEVETSLIEKLDYWTMPPGEQDGGTQHHPAAPGRSRGRNQPNSKTR
jgi:hypothetical protein